MTKSEDDTKNSVKKNMVEMSKTTMDDSVYVCVQSHDETTDKVFNRAKKQFDEMSK